MILSRCVAAANGCRYYAGMKLQTIRRERLTIRLPGSLHDELKFAASEDRRRHRRSGLFAVNTARRLGSAVLSAKRRTWRHELLRGGTRTGDAKTFLIACKYAGLRVGLSLRRLIR
jgi:hypothetical protein